MAADAPSSLSLRPWLPELPDPTDERVIEWRRCAREAGVRLGKGIAQTMRGLNALSSCPIPEAGTLAAPYLADPLYGAVACDIVARSGMDGGRLLLEALLTHPHGTLRFRAASGLGVLGDPAAIAALRAVFDTETDGPVLRWAAISLGELGSDAERAFLEKNWELHTNPLVREGIGLGLQFLGVEIDDRSGPQMELDAHLDRYCDPAHGVVAREFLFAMPDAEMDAVISRLDSGPWQRRFAAADVLGVLRINRAESALETMFNRSVPELMLVAATSLMRLRPGPEIAKLMRQRWFSFALTVRTEQARNVVLIEFPIPDAVVRLLLDDPCALVAPTAAELLRREPNALRFSWLKDALNLEYARIQGAAAPREVAHNLPVLTRQNIERLVADGAPRRSQLPEAFRPAVEELQRTSYADPHVIAAQSLLQAVRSYEDGSAALEPWLDCNAPLLRLDALLHWIGIHLTLPQISMNDDADPTVRRLWRFLA